VDTKLRGRVHDLVLAARELLTAEARSLLEGEYGLHQDARLEAASGLPALRSNPEARETRKRLEIFLVDEGKAGLMAMRYWPDRVAAKCRTDKSLAFAHDRMHLYEGA